VANAFFGLTITIFALEAGKWINKKTKSSLANPLLIAMILVIAFLYLFKIPLEAYELGGSILTFFFPLVTVVLALSIYRQRAVLKEYFIPIAIGTLVGSIVAISSAILSSRLLGLDELIVRSLASKSVTTPVSVALTQQLGGLPALTIASTVITGLTGNLLAPYIGKAFGIKDRVAHGVAIGASSHALGTSKAFELGEVEGSMSSISLSFSALWTTIILALIF